MEPITVSLTTDELLYIAKIYEQTERYEDMADTMRKSIALKQELNVEERNLLSVAYKNCVGNRRAAWRTISSIEQKEGAKGSANLSILRQLKKKIETELDSHCNEIIELLDKTLMPNASNSEAKIFFYKMAGDYYRYIAEYSSEENKKRVSDLSSESYQKAQEILEKELPPTNPIRLGLALSYSVFYYEILNDPVKACELAKRAFDDAIAELDSIPEDQYQETTVILQMIRDNLTLWTSQTQDR